MRRWLSNLPAALSLLLCLGVVWLWAVAHDRGHLLNMGRVRVKVAPDGVQGTWIDDRYGPPLMNEDWSAVLTEFLPKLETAPTARDYHLTVAEMVTHVHDSHAFVRGPEYNRLWSATTLVQVRVKQLSETDTV